MARHRAEEASEALFVELGMYSDSLLNDKKIDGEWVRSVRLSNATYNGRIGRTYFTRTYATWNCLRSRCTEGGAFQRRFAHYVGATMCSEWREDFNAFADWYTQQVGYAEGWDIDKDVSSNTKHYSTDTCVLLPRVINLLFSSRHSALNVVHAPTLANRERYRTKDKRVFTDSDSARHHAWNLRVQRVEELRAVYEPMGIPGKVFDKALQVIEPA